MIFFCQRTPVRFAGNYQEIDLDTTGRGNVKRRPVSIRGQPVGKFRHVPNLEFGRELILTGQICEILGRRFSWAVFLCIGLSF